MKWLKNASAWWNDKFSRSPRLTAFASMAILFLFIVGLAEFVHTTAAIVAAIGIIGYFVYWTILNQIRYNRDRRNQKGNS